MVKLLIVDDEQIEREGMKAILNRAFAELQIKEASNGQQAIEIASSFQPDVVLMDIQMPGINGLDAMTQILKENPQTKFVMVTAFDTFNYVQSALKLGAKDYLLKPSKISEIIKTVGKVIEDLENERKLQEETILREKLLQQTLTLVETDVVTQLLFDHVHDVHLNMLMKMLDIRETNSYFVLNVIVPYGMEYMYTKIKEKVRGKKVGWMGALYDGQLPIIIFKNEQQSYRAQAISIAKEILNIGTQEQKEGWFIGIGNECSALSEVRESYKQARIASSNTTISIKYRFIQDVPKLNKTEERNQAIHLKKDIANYVRLGQWDQLKTSMYQLIQAYELEALEIQQAQQYILETLWSIWHIVSEIGIEVATPIYTYQVINYRQLRAETTTLLQYLQHTYEQHYKNLESDTIQQIKRYIKENSQKNISLELLSEKVGLSPIYISKMFKEKFGINYIEYLTECRIEKAKKMLADPEKSIKEITIEVGYHEPNYFSKVFKKICNVTPREYRRTLLGLVSTNDK